MFTKLACILLLVGGFSLDPDAQEIKQRTFPPCQVDSCMNEFCHQFYERRLFDIAIKKVLLSDLLLVKFKLMNGKVAHFSVRSLRGIAYHQQIAYQAFHPIIHFPCLHDGLHLIPFRIHAKYDPYPTEKLKILSGPWLAFEQEEQKAKIWDAFIYSTDIPDFDQSRLPYIYYPDDNN